MPDDEDDDEYEDSDSGEYFSAEEGEDEEERTAPPKKHQKINQEKIVLDSRADLNYAYEKDGGKQETRREIAEDAFTTFKNIIEQLGQSNCNKEVWTFFTEIKKIKEEINKLYEKHDINPKNYAPMLGTLAKLKVSPFSSAQDAEDVATLTELNNKIFNTVLDIDLDNIQTDTAHQKNSVAALIHFIEPLGLSILPKKRKPLTEQRNAIINLAPELASLVPELPSNEVSLKFNSFHALKAYTKTEFKAIPGEKLEKQLERYQKLKTVIKENNELLTEHTESNPGLIAFYASYIPFIGSPISRWFETDFEKELMQDIKAEILSTFNTKIQPFIDSVNELEKKSKSKNKDKITTIDEARKFTDALKRHLDDFEINNDAEAFKAKLKTAFRKYEQTESFKKYSSKSWFKTYILKPFETLKISLNGLIGLFSSAPGFFKPPKESLLDKFEKLKDDIASTKEKPAKNNKNNSA
ncbi:MAG: hypothetical protein QNK11_07695 [Legionella sp.]|nr:hypothetical protein [Legionella sp.]